MSQNAYPPDNEEKEEERLQDSAAKKTKRKHPRPPRKAELGKDQIKEILRLHQLEFSTRKIEKKVGIGRKVIRNVLRERGLVENRPQPTPRSREKLSKLDPFREQIQEKVKKH